MDYFPSPTGIGPGGVVEFGASADTAVVVFYSRSVLSKFESEKAGGPVYVARDYVRIHHPGEQDHVERQVQEQDKARWPRQWTAYQNKQEQAPEGTLLQHLFPGNPEIVETLSARGFKTVEQLAGASDTALQAIGMGSRGWHERAKKFQAGARKAKAFHAHERELAERDHVIAQQGVLIEALEKRLERLEAGKVPSPAPGSSPGAPSRNGGRVDDGALDASGDRHARL